MTETFQMLQQAVEALISFVAASKAGTAFVGCLILLLALDLLRKSRGPLEYLWRAAAIGAVAILIGSYVYGDFLAAPASQAWADAGFTPDQTWMAAAGLIGLAFLLLLWRRVTAWHA